MSTPDKTIFMHHKNQKQLATYLTAGLGLGSVAPTADAAIINLDISSISGPRTATNSNDGTSFFIAGDELRLYSYEKNSYSMVGIGAWGGDLKLAMTAADDGLFKFETGGMIGSDANWNSDDNPFTYFNHNGTKQPVWGGGRFVGFQANSDTTPLYGWLEVTWDGNDTFEILRGAYDDSGAPIAAGAVAAVPEPASVLGTLGLLAGGMFARRRRLAA